MADRCVHCHAELGPVAKVQPSRVEGHAGSWCPMCYVARRCDDASQTVAAKCVFCGWLVVSRGAQPGMSRLHCTNCSRAGALRVRFADLPLNKAELDAVQDVLNEARKAL